MMEVELIGNPTLGSSGMHVCIVISTLSLNSATGMMNILERPTFLSIFRSSKICLQVPLPDTYIEEHVPIQNSTPMFV